MVVEGKEVAGSRGGGVWAGGGCGRVVTLAWKRGSSRWGLERPRREDGGDVAVFTGAGLWNWWPSGLGLNFLLVGEDRSEVGGSGLFPREGLANLLHVCSGTQGVSQPRKTHGESRPQGSGGKLLTPQEGAPPQALRASRWAGRAVTAPSPLAIPRTPL